MVPLIGEMNLIVGSLFGLFAIMASAGGEGRGDTSFLMLWESNGMPRTGCIQGELFDRPGETPRLFFIQKHHAGRLHYDFRLEHAGVLKSWAMPVGPCLDAAVSREAVLVKDHDMAAGYGEGRIPEGLYGAGTIMVWDWGIWLADQNATRGLCDGELRFRLLGRKLHGNWSLTRQRHESYREKEAWHLQKELDDDSRSLSEMDILIERPESVRSGRTLAEIASDPPPFVLSERGATKKRGTAPKQLPRFSNDDVFPDSGN